MTVDKIQAVVPDYEPIVWPMGNNSYTVGYGPQPTIYRREAQDVLYQWLDAGEIRCASAVPCNDGDGRCWETVPRARE